MTVTVFQAFGHLPKGDASWKEKVWQDIRNLIGRILDAAEWLRVSPETCVLLPETLRVPFTYVGVGPPKTVGSARKSWARSVNNRARKLLACPVPEVPWTLRTAKKKVADTFRFGAWRRDWERAQKRVEDFLFWRETCREDRTADAANWFLEETLKVKRPTLTFSSCVFTRFSFRGGYAKKTVSQQRND